MLKIICGEDSVTSRNYYLSEIKKYKDEGYEVKNIHPKEIEDAFIGITIQTLFGQSVIYCTENLNKFINKRKSADIIVSDKTNEYFILIMLIRHIKKLLLYKINQEVENLAYWQLKKLELQCRFWTK